MNTHMVVVPTYLSERIDRRIAEITAEYPDVDREWLRNEMLVQALSNDVPPEAISIRPEHSCHAHEMPADENGECIVCRAAARREVCAGCGKEIDPETCGCGSPIDHSAWEGHSPIPMGCECGRDLGVDDGFSEGSL